MSLDAFRHAVADRADDYRSVMEVFVAAKASFQVHLRPQDVAEELGLEREEAADLLDRLAGWGNLRADPDTSRVRTVEDFARRRFLYQLTPEGEAAEKAFAAYEVALGSRAELQAVALSDLRTRLAALRRLAREPAPDESELQLTLDGLASRFEGLAENAQAFMGSLWRAVDLHEADLAAFLAYKQRLLAYLERFIGDLTTAAADIAVAIQALENEGADRLLALVAAREARDAAPGADETASGLEERETATAERLDAWRRRWSGLRGWFVSSPSRPAQERLLRDQARTAVPALLRAVDAQHQRRTGRSDRSTDFRRLALWFAECDDDAAAHRLWRSTLALAPSRHLTVDSETLAEREARPVAPSISWHDARPVEVSPRVRRTGSYERRGPARQVRDRSAARAVIGQRLRAEREQTAQARERLATGVATRLSKLGELDGDAFALFLQLLGDVLATGGTEATTGDGSLRIRLLPTDDGALAEVRTPGGVLRGPDHHLTITHVDPEERPRHPAASSAGKG